jgi:hypothetical protein
MLLGDVRGEAIGRHPLPAKPTEGLAGRDVDALHTNSMSGSLPHVKRERDADSSCVVGKGLPIVRICFQECAVVVTRVFGEALDGLADHLELANRGGLPHPFGKERVRPAFA